jgi:hypothetical protein
MVVAGLDEGLLLDPPGPDARRALVTAPGRRIRTWPGRLVDQANIPTAGAMHALARAAAAHSGVWWREMAA